MSERSAPKYWPDDLVTWRGKYVRVAGASISTKAEVSMWMVPASEWELHPPPQLPPYNPPPPQPPDPKPHTLVQRGPRKPLTHDEINAGIAAIEARSGVLYPGVAEWQTWGLGVEP